MSESNSRGAEPVRTGLLEQLWAGDDLALHAALLEELKSAGIPFWSKPAGYYSGVRHGIADFVPQPPFGFEVRVFSSDLTAAQHVLNKLTAAPE
jgi:hypothetical protein